MRRTDRRVPALALLVVSVGVPAVAGPASGASDPTGGAIVALDAESGDAQWRAEPAAGRVIMRPAVAGNRVYATDVDCAGSSSQVVAFDARSGEELWRSESGDQLVEGDADERVVAVYDAGGEVQGLDARTGEVRWSHSVPGAQFAAAESLVLALPSGIADAVGASSSETRAFDGRTGELRWTRALAPAPELMPVGGAGVVSANKRFVVLTAAASAPDATGLGVDLVVLDATSGDELLRSRFEGLDLIAPLSATLVGSSVVYDNRRGELRSLDLESGEVRWHLDVDGQRVATAASAGRYVYLVSSDVTKSGVTAVDAERGKHRWTNERVAAHPIGSGRGTVIVASEDGIVALDSTTGERRWAAPLPARVDLGTATAVLGRTSVFLTGTCDV